MKHMHIWVKREIMRRINRLPMDTAGPGRAFLNGSLSPVYAYVCRCGETGMPVR